MWVLVLALTAAVAACTTGSEPAGAPAAPTTPPGPTTAPTSTSTTVAPAAFTESPADGTRDVDPTAPVHLAVTGGTLRDVTLTNPDGKAVRGGIDGPGTTYRTAEVLGYGSTYTWAGTAVNPAGVPTPVTGSFTTVTPRRTVGATLNIGDGQSVGVAAPIIVQFAAPVGGKSELARRMVVTTTPPTEGAWVWLPDTQGGSRAHWRPKAYWKAGTKVDVALKLYGAGYGDGSFGRADMDVHFGIGRAQIVRADVPTHRMQVIRDGRQVMDVPVSYGKADEIRNTTRTGIHVVTEKIENKLMSNPPYYEDVLEHWSVRISNNGEFIHANPETVGVQGSRNVSNGCVNLHTQDAKQYFDSALYGDPVEVTGSAVPLSAADGDIYDWSIPWPQWLATSRAP